MSLKIAKSSEELPEEIIQEIQERLPVKSLMRFSCVSKWWSSIVADPKFAKSHYLLASQQQTLSRRLLLWNIVSRQFESLDLDTSSLRKLTCFPINLPPEHDSYQISLLGSCNGLVFLCAGGEAVDNLGEDEDFQCFGFYVWNPSTGFVRNLPAPSFTNVITTFNIGNCGFGYVSATDDYKAVFGVSIREGLVFEVFSLRANSWKRVVTASFFKSDHYKKWVDNEFNCQGIVSNDALHWIRYNHGDACREEALINKKAVLVFDLVNDVFRKLQLLIRKEVRGYWTSTLSVGFGGCLSVAFTRYVDEIEYIEVWVMREYNDPESWTKLYIGNYAHQIFRLLPIYCWESCIIFALKRPIPGQNYLRKVHC